MRLNGMIGLRTGLLGSVSASAVSAPYAPAALFASGGQGVWYDPSDLPTVFQDASGTTPAAVGAVVGLVLDKSKGLVPGPELLTNGDFSGGATGWTAGAGWTISGGAATFNGGVGTELYCALSGLTAGRTYKVTFDITGVTSGVTSFSSPGSSTTAPIKAGQNTAYLLFDAAYTRLRFLGVGGNNFSIDNISLRELPGNHATQVTTASKPILRQTGALYYLEFDGVDDSLQTAAIDFTATDKISVFAGLRKLSDTGNGCLVELSATADTNNGAFYIRAPSGGGANYQSLLRGTSLATSTGAQAAPDTAILSVLYDIATDINSMRRNGSPLSTGSGDAGAGNFGNYPLYIGRRAAASLAFNGRIYGLLTLGRAATAGEITATETWLNAKTGAY